MHDENELLFVIILLSRVYTEIQANIGQVCGKIAPIFDVHSSGIPYLPSFVESTQAQCLQHSSSGMGTTFGICFKLHFKCFGGLGATGHDGRHSTFPRSQKQCCSHPVKFTGILLQLSKYWPLYSHVPLSIQRILSVFQIFVQEIVKMEEKTEQNT